MTVNMNYAVNMNYEQKLPGIPYFRQRITTHPSQIGDFVIKPENVCDDKTIPVRIGIVSHKERSSLEISLLEDISGPAAEITLHIKYRGPENDSIIPAARDEVMKAYKLRR